MYIDKLEELIGQKYGELTIINVERKRAKNGENKRVAHCLCSCGKESDVDVRHLKNGHTRSCGHLKNQPSKKRLDLTRNQYGELCVSEMLYKYDYKGNGNTLTCARCVCPCGKEIIVPAKDLRSGHIKSCGCYRKKTMRESHRVDLTGRRFGKLVVQEMIWGLRENGTRTMARCLCDCGNEKIVPANQLTMRQTSSCGCLGTSYGEHFIDTCLNDIGIDYSRQYSFDDCVWQGKLKFDFAIYDKNHKVTLLIEYDGLQHFQPVEFFGGKEGFEATRLRDEAKNAYCEEHHIPLLRLPYTMSDTEIKQTILNTIYP